MIGYFIEKDINLGKVHFIVSFQTTSKAIQIGFISGNKKKKEDISIITPYYQPLSSSYHHLISFLIGSHILLYNTQPYYNPPWSPVHKNTLRPYASVQTLVNQNRPLYTTRLCLNLKARNTLTYTPIVESLAQLSKRLKAAGLFHPIKEKPPGPTS